MKTVCGQGSTLDDIRTQVEMHILDYIIELYEVEFMNGEITSYEDIQRPCVYKSYVKNTCINVMYFKDTSWATMEIDYTEFLIRKLSERTP
jgi:hypothetical protein